ncbi:MAG: dephospho-CoA kinase [Cellvibrionaceae bacterium]
MFVVGVTGGIGSGKTAVTDKLKSLGITIVDADVVAREVVELGQPALTKIKEYFGDEILLPDGNLDRAKLRNIVFESSEKRKWLEALLHPLIYSEIQKQLQEANSRYAVLVSPLLVETSQNLMTNRILVVDAPEEIQLKRASARDGVSEEQVKSIMKAQTSREERKIKADDIILNDKDLSHLEQRTEVLHEHYLKLADNQQSKNS